MLYLYWSKEFVVINIGTTKTITLDRKQTKSYDQRKYSSSSAVIDDSLAVCYLCCLYINQKTRLTKHLLEHELDGFSISMFGNYITRFVYISSMEIYKTIFIPYRGISCQIYVHRSI